MDLRPKHKTVKLLEENRIFSPPKGRQSSTTDNNKTQTPKEKN